MEQPPYSANAGRRDAIVTAAREAFIRDGFGNTSMSSIAKAAGGSKTTLWNCFENKQALFDAVVDDLITNYGETLRTPLPVDGDCRTTLEDFAASIISTISSPQIVALHRMVIGEAARFPQLGEALVDRGIRRGRGRLADWLSVQMELGNLRADDPHVASEQFSALCHGGSFERHLLGACPRPDRKTIAREASIVAETFWRAYGP